MWFEVALVHPVRAERRLGRDGRRGQRGRSVAGGVSLAVVDVVREVLVEELRPLAADRGVGGLGRVLLGVLGPGRQDRGQARQRTVRSHGRLEVSDDRQALGVDHDLGHRIGGGGFRLGDDEGDRVAHEQRLVACERLEHPHVVGAGDRQVGRRQDGHDARHGEGGRCVDRADPGVGVDARHDPGMEQAGPALVGGVAGRAADLLLRIDPGKRQADEARSLRCVDHDASSRLR